MIFSGTEFFHGTKANPKPGDLIEPGFNSNFGQSK
jgi:rifampin ADP-ribosylating transferase